MDENEKNEQSEDAAPAEESPREEIDAAKLSDEAAAQAARAFLGTAEPVEEVSVALNSVMIVSVTLRPAERRAWRSPGQAR